LGRSEQRVRRRPHFTGALSATAAVPQNRDPIDAGVPAVLSSAFLDRGAHVGIPVIIACPR
jgi:hypothetical protein